MLFLIGNFSSGLAEFLNKYSNDQTFFGKLIFNLVIMLFNFGRFAAFIGVIINIFIVVYYLFENLKRN